MISSSLISLLIKSRTYLHTTLAGFFFITVCVWNVSSSIQNWCLRFFCIRAKLIHVFVSELLLLSSLSLLLLLSFSLSRRPFSFLSSPPPFVDHCVSSANLCRRRSVAFVHRGKRTQKNAPGIARNIGNVVGEGIMHNSHGVALSSSVTRMRLERERVGRRGTRCGGATGSVVLIWDQRGDVTWTARDRAELWSELSMLINSAVVPNHVQTAVSPQSAARQLRSSDNNSCNTSY